MSIKDLLQMLRDRLLVEAEFTNMDVSIDGQCDDARGQLILKLKVEGQTKIIRVNAHQLMALQG